jgi:hypothetical protein
MILDSVRVEGTAGVQIGIDFNLGKLATGSFGLGSLNLGVGASGNDLYSFEESSGPSAGIVIGDKIQFGWTPTVGRSEQGRYDVPQRETHEEGEFAFGLKGKAGDADVDTSSTGSSTELSMKVGFFGGVELKVDVGQLAYGIFGAKPGEEPGQAVEARVQSDRGNSLRVK